MTIASADLGSVVTCDNCLEEFTARAEETVTPASTDPPDLKREEPSTPDAVENRRPDDEFTRDEYPEKQRKVLESDYEFTIRCPLCATQQDVTDAQVGGVVRCPDCHSKIRIREPSARRRRPIGRHSESRPEEDEELKLSPLEELPVREPVVPMIPVEPTEPIEYDSPGEAALRKAEAETEQEEEEAPGLPARPLIHGGLTFLFEPTLIARWLALSIAVHLFVNAVEGAILSFSDPDPFAQFMALALVTVCTVFGVILFVGGSVTALTLLRETANGNDPVTDWPNFDPVDWFLDSLYMISSATVSLVAGAMIGNLFSPLGPSAHLVALSLIWTAAFILVFPPLLLSTLEGGSPIQFASVPVWRSLRAAGGAWIRFALLAAAVAGIAFALWQLRRFDSLIADFLATVSTVGGVLIFFRLLGRLARVSQQVLAEREERELEAAETA